jgi:hypothetical protein
MVRRSTSLAGDAPDTRIGVQRRHRAVVVMDSRRPAWTANGPARAVPADGTRRSLER